MTIQYRVRHVIVLLIGLLCLSSCTADSDVAQQDIVTIQEYDTEEVISEEKSETEDHDLNTTTAESVQTTEYDIYQLEMIPEYNGNPYVELNNNIPAFSEADKSSTEAFEYYSDLDALGRCGQAYANICPELQPTGERGPIGQVKPSGWHTVKYSELIDDNYLYNRCHLIGYQLAGENANENNLITGTRYLNVTGMLLFEDRVADYVAATGNHVLYRVTPVFDGDNLVASGVQMEAWSVEDSGAGICFNVYCYNVQPGIEIDYATGDSFAVEAQNLESEQASEAAQDETVFGNQTEYTLIINMNTKKFHLETCSSVDDMAEHNKKMYKGTIEELIEQGYSPCKRCILF